MEDEIDKNEIQIRLGEVIDYFLSNEGTVNLDVFMTLAFTQSNRVVKFLIKSWIILGYLRSSMDFISQFIKRGYQGIIGEKLHKVF